MIYGNKARAIYVKSNYSISEESILFDLQDRDFLTENIFDAVMNDDMQLLEYCAQYSNTEVLTESVKDLFNKVIEIVKSLIDKVKNFIRGAINKIKSLLQKPFKTDDKGNLKNNSGNKENVKNESSYYLEADSDKFNSLYDLVDEELSKPIEIPSKNLATITDIVYGRLHLDRYAEDCKSFVEEIKKYMMDLNTALTGKYEERMGKYGGLDRNDKKDVSQVIEAIKENIATSKDDLNDKINDLNNPITDKSNNNADNWIKVSREQLDFILEYSKEDTIQDCTNKINEIEKEADKELNNIISSLKQWSALNNGYVKGEVSDKDFEELKSIAANAVSSYSNYLSRYCTIITSKMINEVHCCESARRQLETELIKMKNKTNNE